MEELIGQIFGGIFGFIGELIGGVIEGIFTDSSSATGMGTSRAKPQRSDNAGTPETASDAQSV